MVGPGFELNMRLVEQAAQAASKNATTVARVVAAARMAAPAGAALALSGDTPEDKVVGSQTRYKVTLEDVDARVPIEDAKFQKLERLSARETIHILARIRKGTKWF